MGRRPTCICPPAPHRWRVAISKGQHMTQTQMAFTIPEACTTARISRSGLYRAIKDGELRARKRGVRTLILADDLRQWLENLPTSNSSQKAA